MAYLIKNTSLRFSILIENYLFCEDAFWKRRKQIKTELTATRVLFTSSQHKATRHHRPLFVIFCLIVLLKIRLTIS